MMMSRHGVAGLAQRIRRGFRHGLVGGRADVIALDIGTRVVKFVELSRRGQEQYVRRLGRMDLPEPLFDGQLLEPEVLTAVLRERLSKQGVMAKNAVLSVGGRSLFIRKITFPRMSAKELREAVRWEMENYVPFEPGSFYYDYAVLSDKSTATEIHILLAAVPQDWLGRLVAAVRAAGLSPIAVEPEPLAVSRLFPAAEDAMVLDIGGAISQIFMYRAGIPVVVRTLPIGGSELAQTGGAEPVAGSGNQVCVSARTAAMAEEVQRTLEYLYRQEQEITLAKVYVTGGGATSERLAEQLTVKLGRPVSVLSAPATIVLSPSYDQGWFASVQPQFSLALGLALPGGLPLNLLPPAQRVSKRAVVERWAAVGGVLLLLGASWHGYGLWSIRQAENQLAQVTDQCQALRPIQGKMELAAAYSQTTQQKSVILTGIMKSRRQWSSVLERFGAVTPDHVWLKEIASSEQDLLIVKGNAVNYSDLTDFLQCLATDSVFSNPVLQQASMDEKSQTVSFELAVRLKEL